MRNCFLKNFENENFAIVKKNHTSEKLSSLFHKQRKKVPSLFYDELRKTFKKSLQ